MWFEKLINCLILNKISNRRSGVGDHINHFRNGVKMLFFAFYSLKKKKGSNVNLRLMKRRSGAKLNKRESNAELLNSNNFFSTKTFYLFYNMYSMLYDITISEYNL